MDDWSRRYNRHIRSSRWRNMREDMIKLRGNRCEHCGGQTTLTLHHKNYERLGRELTSDLELLCKPCHTKADAKRAAEGRARSEYAYKQAGFNRWGEKVYGDNWCDTDPYDAAERYENWLEKQY